MHKDNTALVDMQHDIHKQAYGGYQYYTRYVFKPIRILQEDKHQIIASCLAQNP